LPGFYELTRIQAEAIIQRTRPQPVRPILGHRLDGMAAEQEKAKQVALSYGRILVMA
jgi:hypothetical protein